MLAIDWMGHAALMTLLHSRPTATTRKRLFLLDHQHGLIDAYALGKALGFCDIHSILGVLNPQAGRSPSCPLTEGGGRWAVVFLWSCSEDTAALAFWLKGNSEADGC